MIALTLRSRVASTTLALITVAALDRTREISKKGVRNHLMLKGAKQIDLTIPPNVLVRANKVIR